MNDDQSSVSSLRGKVAEVVSEREVILNKGKQDGVREGSYFKVLDPAMTEIVDPDTGADLGGFSVIKVVVVAIQVADRVTLARTFRRNRVNVGGIAGGFSSLMSPPEYVEQIERIRREEPAPGTRLPTDSVVRVGDPFQVATPKEIEDVQTVTVRT